MKIHARARQATSKTPGRVLKAGMFLPSPKSALYVLGVVDKGILAYVYNSTNEAARTDHGIGSQ